MSRKKNKKLKNSGKFCRSPDRPESFKHIGKVSRQSGNFPDCLESFQTILGKISASKLFNIFSVCVETIRIDLRFSGNTRNVENNWQVPKLTWEFPDSLESFQTFQKTSRLCGNFPDNPKKFQTQIFPLGLEPIFMGNFRKLSNSFTKLWGSVGHFN